MAYPTMQAMFALAHIGLIAMLAGCQFSPDDDTAAHPDAMQASAKKTMVFQQLIIKFKPNTIACDADAIAQFSLAINVPIEFVRVMSGQACVVRQFTSKQVDLSKGILLLRQHPDVEWVEPDLIKKAL
ncbi:MAG: hypothetical protein ACXU7H_02755 [Burkholderiaceae bacterium]